MATPSPGTIANCELNILHDIGLVETVDVPGLYPSDQCYAPHYDPTFSHPGRVYARYYSFYLDVSGASAPHIDAAHVIVDLRASPADTVLTVFDADGRSGTWSSNDNNDEILPGSTNTNSRVALKLDGNREYFIKVSLHGTPPSNSVYRLIVQTAEWIPSLGHQRDHVAQYRIGVTPTPVPGSTHDPSVIVPGSYQIAAKAWNDAISNAWPNVTVCERGVSCPTLHDDQQTITLNTVDNANGSHCRGRAACLGSDPGPHIGSLEIKVGMNSKATVTFITPNGNQKEEYTVVWTNDDNEHGQLDTAKREQLTYLPSVMMHEFGHVLGLADLYLDEYGNHYDGYLMKESTKFPRPDTAIPGTDIRYAHQVYRNRHGARPH